MEHLLQSFGDAFGPCLSKQFQNPIYTFKSFAEFQPLLFLPVTQQRIKQMENLHPCPHLLVEEEAKGEN